ncbi:MAG TPA: hypothetical protein VNP20_06910 [Nocardioidaceae bacterium]|nr:hypothetical protein [Nocardioidaceae bacterium]
MSRKRSSIRAAFQGVLTMEEAAELLRVDSAAVEEAGRLGDLPTVQIGDDLYIDGPALRSQFTEPACKERGHAS